MRISQRHFLVFFTVLFVLWQLWLPVFAAEKIEGGTFLPKGLVPCGTSANPTPCTPCHIFILVQNVLNFIWIGIAIPLAVLMFIYGGILMVIPGIGGEKSAAMYTKGKKVLTNAVIGIIIVFFAWLVIDTIMKVLIDPGTIGSGKPAELLKGLGPWNEIKCSATVR